MNPQNQPTERNRRAIDRTHGWLKPHATFEQIGAEIGVSKQRAKQIYESAMGKIVRGLNRHDISPETIHELLATEPRQAKEPDAAATRVHWFG